MTTTKSLGQIEYTVGPKSLSKTELIIALEALLKQK